MNTLLGELTGNDHTPRFDYVIAAATDLTAFYIAAILDNSTGAILLMLMGIFLFVVLIFNRLSYHLDHVDPKT